LGVEGGVGHYRMPILPALLRYYSVEELIKKFGIELYLKRIHYAKLVAHYQFGKMFRRQKRIQESKKLKDCPKP
jgi:hypothetical protein